MLMFLDNFPDTSEKSLTILKTFGFGSTGWYCVFITWALNRGEPVGSWSCNTGVSPSIVIPNALHWDMCSLLFWGALIPLCELYFGNQIFQVPIGEAKMKIICMDIE